DANRAGGRPANGQTDSAVQVRPRPREAGTMQHVVDLVGARLERRLGGPREIRGGSRVDGDAEDEQDRERDRAAPGYEAPTDPTQQPNVPRRRGILEGRRRPERSQSQTAHLPTPSVRASPRSGALCRSGARSRYPTP